MTLTGTGFPRTRSEKSSLAHDSRYAPNAGTAELSSECCTTWSMKMGDSRPPVVMVMIAARFFRAVAAPLNSTQPSSSNGTPVAGTGFSATSRRTRPGACSTACWITLPDQAEALPAELVGQGQGVGRGLRHGEVAGHVPAAAVAAQVREDVGERRAVQVVGQR